LLICISNRIELLYGNLYIWLALKTHLDKLNDILQRFDPISLKEMDRVKLLNRTDTKFVFKRSDLPEILEKVCPHYSILEIENLRQNKYRTLYYDTPDFGFYTRHQNGKLNRYKVRFRKYVDSGLCFLEIKFKNNKARTVKSRVKVPDFEAELSEDSIAFIQQVMGTEVELVPKLWNTFTRLTLVSKKDTERLTIDLNLGFEYEGREQSLDKVVIAEVKQEKMSRNSTFVRTVKSMGIRPIGMSKYCIGTTVMNGDLKYNNFKQKLLIIKKLSDGVLT
jgi:hypothetical protein